MRFYSTDTKKARTSGPFFLQKDQQSTGQRVRQANTVSAHLLPSLASPVAFG